jgi:hypothetical protein
MPIGAARLGSLLLLLAMSITACASPGPQIQLVDVSLRRQPGRVATIDVMPIGTIIDTIPGHKLSVDEAGAVHRAAVLQALPGMIAARHYKVAAIIDSSGRYSVGKVRQAMTGSELVATREAVRRYADAQRAFEERPTLDLPVRLGRATGSDATLFVGGRSLAGDEETSYADFLGALELLTLFSSTVGAVGAAADGDAEAAHEIMDEGLANAAYLHERAEELEPVKMPPSRLGLTMTLVDNATGKVLWHQDRSFWMDPTNPIWVRRAVELCLRGLPRGQVL